MIHSPPSPKKKEKKGEKERIRGGKVSEKKKIRGKDVILKGGIWIWIS